MTTSFQKHLIFIKQRNSYISVYIGPITTKIWKARMYGGVKSLEINKVGTSYVITLNLNDFKKVL